MGEEKLDNTVYTIRGLYDLADMARATPRQRHRHVGRDHGARARAALRGRLVGGDTASTPTR